MKHFKKISELDQADGFPPPENPPLFTEIKKYNYFDYETSEALHLSQGKNKSCGHCFTKWKQNITIIRMSLVNLLSYHIISVINFPKSFDIGIVSTKVNPEVIIYFINKLEDIERFVKFCNSAPLPKDNRTIMVYQKGRKDLNRDTIITPFRNGHYQNFKFKAPMLCSLSNELSAFVLTKGN
jgi:hypothetical protein